MNLSSSLAVVLLFASILAVHGAAASATSVLESAREIPVAYDVDVVVVGGSCAAVAAAVEAAAQGADVFLAAPRPYLGEDVCGTYRLWLRPGEEPDTPLGEALFAEAPAPLRVGPSLPFTYQADVPSNSTHPDTDPPSKLADGKSSSAYNESVQYDGDVSIVAELSEPVRVGRVHVLGFQRNNDIELASITAASSVDGQTWAEAGAALNEQLGQGEYLDAPLYLTVNVACEARYIKVVAKKSLRVGRLLLGEIVIEPEQADEPASERGRVPPMPLQVKRVLDQALVDAGVAFLYGCYATDVLRDGEGKPAGIVMANRSGRQAVLARTIIDATPRGSVARMAGASFRAFPSGAHVFERTVVGGEAPDWTAAEAHKLSPPVQAVRQTLKAPSCYDAIRYTLHVSMKDASFASFANAEQIARDRTWTAGQVGASEMLFQVPPDAVRGQASVAGSWPGAAAVDLAAFSPDGLEGVYVLGGCADVSRAAAAHLLRPLTLLAVGARVGNAAAKEAGAKPKPTVVCFGDSLTAGGYPARLQDLLRGFRVVNAGAGGDTSTQGLARLEAEVLAAKPQAVVVLFGTNDSVLNGPGRYRTAVGRFEANLTAIAGRCKEAGAEVLLCTVPPIIDEPYFSRHPKEHYDAEGGLSAVLARYRAAAQRVAVSVDVQVVDLAAALAEPSSALRPDGVHLSATGERMVAALVAGKLARVLSPPAREGRRPQGVHLAAATQQAAVAGDIREPLGGLRSFQVGIRAIEAEACALPVLGTYDVVVVGGGTGGAPAGIAAARQGAKTLVVEYLYGLGGVGTLGLIGKYYHGYRGGFTAEIDRGVDGMDGFRKKDGSWDVEVKMEWLRRELRQAGADIWFGTLGCGALVDGDTVKGVVVATPEGRGVVLAKVVIDSTGNADVAASAGASCVYTDGSHVAVQGTGMPPRRLGASYTNTDYTLTDDGDVVDVWRTFVAAREKYEGAYDLGQLVDTRERRRIVGDFVMSPLDIYNRRTFPDTIGLSTSNFDTHGFTIHPFFALKAPDKGSVSAYTPYRCLTPKGLDGILVTGLGVSAHRDAMPILRMQPDIQNQGYAAGVAAAMAARENKGTRDIDFKALQRHLVEQGCLPETVLSDQDSYPLSDEAIATAVARAANDYDGIGVILAAPEASRPLLEAAYHAAPDEAARGVYAHILGMMGNAAGADALAAAVASQDWDRGWSFTGGGQFGASLSPLDSLIIALARTRDRGALAPIIDKAAALGPEHPFSHHRAVAVAVETLASPEASQTLAALLSKPGMMGYAVKCISDAKEQASFANANLSRELSLRELILARALFRCGDHEGLGERILTEYASDWRGHHARHATAVLSEKRRP